MDRQFAEHLKSSLVWLPEKGMGFYPVTEAPYDADYFAKYQRYADTEMGQAITLSRVSLVDRHIHTNAPLVDIGIGCGAFIEARPGTKGYDINPVGVEWLRSKSAFFDIDAAYEIQNVSMWDVLEHIPEPHKLLAKVKGYVFLSIPIFTDGAHVLRSKHFRPDEHCHYFTADGLRRWMEGYGFEFAEWSMIETELGREDIGTFCFRRAT